MLCSGVHAETRLVTTEHLPGSVLAAPPQKVPDPAKVHRRRHVSPLLDETLVFITKRIIRKHATCIYNFKPQKQVKILYTFVHDLQH